MPLPWDTPVNVGDAFAAGNPFDLAISRDWQLGKTPYITMAIASFVIL